MRSFKNQWSMLRVIHTVFFVLTSHFETALLRISVMIQFAFRSAKFSLRPSGIIGFFDTMFQIWERRTGYWVSNGNVRFRYSHDELRPQKKKKCPRETEIDSGCVKWTCRKINLRVGERCYVVAIASCWSFLNIKYQTQVYANAREKTRLFYTTLFPHGVIKLC